jgi:exodeoxyribonuclease VII small subunit
MRLPDVEDLSFEEAVAELDKITRWLESHDATLDETVRAFERGTQLRHHCESILSEAQDRIDGLANETPNRPEPMRQTRRRLDKTPGAT